MTRKPRETKVSFFSAGTVKAVCISAQFPKGLPALNVKLTVYHLRWTSLALCYWGFLLFLALFSPLFLQPVTSQCTYLKPTFLATIPPRLYKETVFVLCVFLVSFTVSHNESELVLLWPLRSRPVISVVLILRVSFFVVHSWLSFCFRHMVWIYIFLVSKQVNLKVSFDFGQACLLSLEIEFKVIQQLSFCNTSTLRKRKEIPALCMCILTACMLI